LWALALEFIVPPLSLLVGLSALGLIGISAISWLVQSWVPFASFCGLTAIGVVGLFFVWLKEGRAYMSPRTAMRIPAYLAMKAPLYLRFITARQRTWERTARNSGSLGVSGGSRLPRDAG
jgi:hypothetical protein